MVCSSRNRVATMVNNKKRELGENIMAQFYASIQGSRGEATRMGTKNSGIEGHIRGWNVGARVSITHVDGKDVVRVFKTTGSAGSDSEKLLAEFIDGEPGITLARTGDHTSENRGSMSEKTYTTEDLDNVVFAAKALHNDIADWADDVIDQTALADSARDLLNSLETAGVLVLPFRESERVELEI